MKKTLKKLLTLALCAALAFSVCVPALASVPSAPVITNPTIIYHEDENVGFTFDDGGNTEAVFTADDAYRGGKDADLESKVAVSSTTSLFDAAAFSNLFPGDSVASDFTVGASGNNVYSYYIYMYARAIDADDADMLNFFDITVTEKGKTVSDTSWLYRLWNELVGTLGFQTTKESDTAYAETVIYEAEGGASVLLGVYAPGATKDFTINLKIDENMGNKYQDSFAEIQWVFVAQQIIPPGPGPSTTPIPGDDPPLLNLTDHFAYIVGYPDGNVHPEGNITRAEVATIFFRLLKDDTRDGSLTTQNSFADVDEGDWYCRAVSTLASLGIVDGYPDGKFYPNAYITRAEFATIAARFDEEADDTSFGFTDVDGHWAEVAINEAANNGWVEGYEDGTFLPNKDITRAEAVTLINRVLHRLPETPDDLLKVMLVWPDNMDTSAWYYLAMQEATNSHNYEYKTDRIHETWTELRETRDWTQYEK